MSTPTSRRRSSPRSGPGQKVRIEVDAFPDRDIAGTVESVSPASGSVFSLLPPENATGNFTKIVQRVPVRIAVDPEVAQQGLLRPGPLRRRERRSRATRRRATTAQTA